MAGVYIRILMVVLASVLLTTTNSHPTWLQDRSANNKGVEDVVPLVLFPLFTRHQQVVKDVARKRNAELLNTLLGSQDLSYMRSAGRR